MFGIKPRPLKRPALAGEVCTCGEPAVVVFEHVGATLGSCQGLDVIPRSGPCPFCGTTGRHATEGVCPSYTLRPAWATERAQHALGGTPASRAAAGAVEGVV